MNRIRRSVRTIAMPAHLRSTLLIAAIVGSWLTAFNLGDFLLTQSIDFGAGVKILLNYLTPFVVANLGLISREV